MRPGPARQAALELLAARHPEELDWLTRLYLDDQAPTVDTDWPDELAYHRRQRRGIRRVKERPEPRPPTAEDLERLSEAVADRRLSIGQNGRAVWHCTCGAVVKGGPGRCAGACPDNAPWVRAAVFAQALEDGRIETSPAGKWYEVCSSCGSRMVGGHPADCNRPRPTTPTPRPDPVFTPTPAGGRAKTTYEPARGTAVDTRTEVDGCFDCDDADATLFGCPDGQDRCSGCRRKSFRLRGGVWEPKPKAAA